VDGLDVELTIDRDLQAAAQATLAHPELPSDFLADELWFANPVGAIALITGGNGKQARRPFRARNCCRPVFRERGMRLRTRREWSRRGPIAPT